jgi:hypothetical protein
MEYKENYMKNIFEWRKRMLHNIVNIVTKDIFATILRKTFSCRLRYFREVKWALWTEENNRD